MCFLMINTELMTYKQSIGREIFLKWCASQEEALYQMLKDYLPMALQPIQFSTPLSSSTKAEMKNLMT